MDFAKVFIIRNKFGWERNKMLDIKVLRSNPELLNKAFLKSKGKFDIEGFLALDAKRRELLFKVEQMKSKQNTDSKLIPQYKKEGRDTTALMDEMKALSDSIKEIDLQVKEVDDQLDALMLTIPNIPSELVPEGDSDADNQEIRKWGEPRKFDFTPKAHWDIG
jgi:seryl-tRNA synthetase